MENQVPGLSFQAPTPIDTKEDGVVFVGWDNNLDKSGAGVVPENATTYTAQYKEDKNNDGVADEEQYVDVTFQIAEEDSDKGTIEGEASLTNLVPGLEMSVPSVTDTEGDDWAFDGWTPALTTDEEGKKVLVPTADQTYTATWKEDKNHDNIPDEDETKYTITYETGTDDEVANMPEPQTNVLKNTTQTVSTQVPTRSGYVFNGWTTDDVEVKDGTFTMPEQDVTFTATWRVDSNGDGIADEDQDLNKPEDSDSDKDSEKTDGEDTAAATNVGIFASLATSALAGMGILTALKKRRKN